MAIGLYGAYGQSEATYVGLRLVDLALLGSGCRISWLPSNPPEVTLNEYWDRHVSGNHRRWQIVKWISEMRQILWLQWNGSQLEVARKHQTRNVVMPFWHQMTSENWNAISAEDVVVCATNSISETLDRNLARKLKGRARTILWDPGTPLQEPFPESSHPFSFYCPVESASARRYGAAMVSAWKRALANPKVHLTLVKGSTLPADILKAMFQLERQHSDRVVVLNRAGDAERLILLAKHTWLWLFDLTDNLGHAALEGLACGVPVFAFDIAPRNEFLRHGDNAFLIHCELKLNWIGAPEAVPDSAALNRAIDSVCSSKSRMSPEACHAPLIFRRERFHAEWSEVWSGAVVV